MQEFIGDKSKKMKTFSFLDRESQDLLKSNGRTLRIKAEDHAHANHLFIEEDISGKCDNWTNTGTNAWCWEDME